MLPITILKNTIVELDMTFWVHHVQGLGLAIGAAFMDVKKATTFASVTLMTFMLSGGFFVKVISTSSGS